MATILHKIKAWLYDNRLTQDNPNDYTARVESERSLGIGDICVTAATRGGADISASAMEHAVNLFFKEMGYQLCDGYSVNTGWFVAGVHIRGTFDSPVETFDPKKHVLLFEFHQGALLRKEMEQISVEVLGIADTGTEIAQVVDVKIGSVNDLLTPERNLRIAGYKIKIAGEHADNGVYFVNQATSKRTKVESSDIVTNNPSELIVVIPVLAAGTYRIELTTQFSGNSKAPLKEPRTANFDRILTVR
ncbi:MAG: DUF4469 domain-containing protein [Tannerella sp.]|jgi:hypothetical protein|nr:DUF4469 domain-containing protein [Tannerella sp.]